MKKKNTSNKQTTQYQSCGCHRIGAVPVKPGTDAGLKRWYVRWVKLNKKNINRTARVTVTSDAKGVSQAQVISQFWDVMHTVHLLDNVGDNFGEIDIL